MTSEPASCSDSKGSSSTLHPIYSSASTQNASAPRRSVSRNAFSDTDSLPPIDEVPVDGNSYHEADMIHRVEACLNRREPLFEAGFPADPTGNRIFSSRPPSSLSGKNVLRHKILDDGRSSSLLSGEECDQGPTSDFNEAFRTPVQHLRSNEAGFPLDERSPTSFLHRSETFRSVGVPPSRFESSSKRVLGRLARALLQVDSVSVHYRNRATAEVGPFRRLLHGYKPLERMRPPGYLRFKNAGSNMGHCSSLGLARGHQSLRLLVTVAFLLVAFILASGLLAMTHADNLLRHNKDVGGKHGWLGKIVNDNVTGVDASATMIAGSSFVAMEARRQILANEDSRLSIEKDISTKENQWNKTEKNTL
ncbi:hypothetical protein MRX96_014737 [Rhipicephalus microplus]